MKIFTYEWYFCVTIDTFTPQNGTQNYGSRVRFIKVKGKRAIHMRRPSNFQVLASSHHLTFRNSRSSKTIRRNVNYTTCMGRDNQPAPTA